MDDVNRDAAIKAEVDRRVAIAYTAHENAQHAQTFLATANQIGATLTLIERLAGVNDDLNAEAEAAQEVLSKGEDVMVALRRLAMRFDRGAYLSQEPER